MAKVFEKLFGTHSQREIKRLMPIVEAIEKLDEPYSKLSDSELRAKTDEFKTRLNNGETLDDILPEAFATIREASWRVLGLKHYRVQLIAGIVLHQGRIGEMRTGEGKTLMATLPAYLNALEGKGVHLITVNDYLAKRDSEWMGKVYKYLGLTVGLVIHAVEPGTRKPQYLADITYGTNNEFGFDYLRDNMAVTKGRKVQRGHHFCIVDEVDSILIDEARTPLIISGQGDASTKLYMMADQLAQTLSYKRMVEVDDKEAQDDIDVDYLIDEKAKTATLTPKGMSRAEKAFNLENITDTEHSGLVHHINQAIKARSLMTRDIDYVIQDGKVIIVDEFTGRLMFGRRYNEGLHQAIEAKERVKVENESKTLATITFQNYFRLYKKLSGMTGTALTEEDEFRHIYNLDVIEVPTNRPIQRLDNQDAIFKNEKGKLTATIRKVKACYEKGQPILVGTVSIEKSELLSRMLKREGVPHKVLNAKMHEKEAEIVAQAGKAFAVTIATNMAGRGTDIVLGGNPEYLALDDMRREGMTEEMLVEATGHGETDNQEILDARARFAELHEKHKAVTSIDAEKVKAAGGLCILGTERHESRRIDNQLRGRAGRQGDPGESNFYLSLDDDLMRLFGGERVTKIMEALNVPDDEPLEQKVLSNSIESAQKKVEGRSFSSRKSVLQYDDVMNVQRKVIYGQRDMVLAGESVQKYIQNMINETIDNSVAFACGEDVSVSNDAYNSVMHKFAGIFVMEEIPYAECSKEDFVAKLKDMANARYQEREQAFSSNFMRELERIVLLKVVDVKWMAHIDDMQELRNGVSLRAYGQHDPVLEYKREGFDMFENMINEIREEVVRMIFTFAIRQNEPPKAEPVAKITSTSADDGTLQKRPTRVDNKVGRNDLCPCGSGKKYKKCCGAADAVHTEN
ncbi:MAG: preprotein translocase subunit SecA [Clostridia bacterium]